ncbi:MAG: TIGR02147 family protein [Fibrobacteres bacterium]|nr:TIGR02147 family protein [Fibrobacterota bacterium]
MKPLTAYTDYRAYLRDVVDDRKKKGLPCSNRWFALRAGMQSTSWLTSLLQGRKGLSQASADKLSKALGHTGLQSRYFLALVEFNQAKGAGDRQSGFLKLQAMARLSDPQLVRETQYGFYSAWHHSVIRALLAIAPFRDDYAALGAALRPPLTAQEAQKSVKLLSDLGLVEPGPDGALKVAAAAITTGRKASALQVDLFHQQTLRLAMEAMDRFAKPDREFSTMTIGIAPELLPMVKDILAEARRRIGELAEASETASRVYQVNMQVFPLSAAYGTGAAA